MNILLTGATGFLGSHLLPELIKKEHKVIILRRSFSDDWRIKNYISQVKSYEIDKINIEKVFKDNKIDVIIHLATDYGRKNNNDIMKMIEPNIKLPSMLLDLAVKNRVKMFINSDTSFDSKYTLYSATKKAFLEMAKFFISNFDIKFVNMVLEYIYGEKDDVSKFVPFVIYNILKGKEIKATQGEQKRDFIYVKDVTNAYIAVLDSVKNFKENYIEFNIGTGKSISLRDFIKVVEKITEKKAKIKWGALPYRKCEVFDSKDDISNAKKILGWKPKTSLEDGLEKTIEWYKRYDAQYF